MKEEKTHVFISHEKEDEEMAERLYADLTKKGIMPFTFEKNVLPGENMEQKLNATIRQCEFFIALLSKASQSKPRGTIWKEFRIASKIREDFSPDKIFIIPVRIEDCEIKTDWLAELKSADLFPSYHSGLKQIFRVLEVPDPGVADSPEPDFESAGAGFVDRHEELEDACHKNAAPYILFEAPPGYGKTKLLQAIGTKHNRSGWICVYVKIPEGTMSVTDLARHIAYKAGCTEMNDLSDPREIGLVFAGFMKNRVCSKRAPGAVLLIDSVERVPKDEIDDFINRFLIAIHQSFNLRVRLARRYSDSSWKGKNENFRVHILTPLPFEYVREVVKLLCKNRERMEMVAAHLMHIAGGHPNIMANLLSNCEISSAFLQSNGKIYQEEISKPVLETARQIRGAIPDYLKGAFDVLCFFRRFNYRLLKRMVKDGLIEHDEGADGLERDLTATFMVKRKDGFLQDIVSRHLLHIRLFLEEPDRFLQLCETAGQIYEEDLQESANARAEFIAIEAILNRLQLAYYRHIRNNCERTDLYSQFFSEDGILYKYLEIILARSDAPDIKANFVSFLEDGYDWEFQFAVNFYLRGNMFGNGPYETMLGIVKKYFAPKTGVNHA